MKQRYELNYEILGKRIKKYREINKLRQQDLAERVHITTNQIAKLETNKTTTSLETIINIANILQIDINALLLNEELRETSTDYMDLLISNQLKDFNAREKEALLLVINAMRVCKDS